MQAAAIQESPVRLSTTPRPAFLFMRITAWTAIPAGVLYLTYVITKHGDWDVYAYMKPMEVWRCLGWLLSSSLDTLFFIAVLPVTVWSLTRMDQACTSLASGSPLIAAESPSRAWRGTLSVSVCWIAGGVAGLLLMESGLSDGAYGIALQGLLVLCIAAVCGAACEEFRNLLQRLIRQARGTAAQEDREPIKTRGKFWPSATQWALYIILILFLFLPAFFIAFGSILEDGSRDRTWELLLYGHWAVFLLIVVLSLDLIIRAARAWRLAGTQQGQRSRSRRITIRSVFDQPWLVLTAMTTPLLVWSMLESVGLESLTILFWLTISIFAFLAWKRSQPGLTSVDIWTAYPAIFPAWWTVLYITGSTGNNGHINPATAMAVVWAEGLILGCVFVARRSLYQYLRRRVGTPLGAALRGWQKFAVGTVLTVGMLLFALNQTLLFLDVQRSDLPLLKDDTRSYGWGTVSYSTSNHISPSIPSHYAMLDQRDCTLDMLMGSMPLLMQSLFHMVFVALLMRELFLMAQMAAEAHRKLESQGQTNLG